MKNPRSIIKLPVVTEKSTAAREDGWYVFSVDRRCNKKEIRDSVEKIFGVKVGKVRTLVAAERSEEARQGGGQKVRGQKGVRQAQEGEINLFEGV